jgi:hypothetical protein
MVIFIGGVVGGFFVVLPAPRGPANMGVVLCTIVLSGFCFGSGLPVRPLRGEGIRETNRRSAARVAIRGSRTIASCGTSVISSVVVFHATHICVRFSADSAERAEAILVKLGGELEFAAARAPLQVVRAVLGDLAVSDAGRKKAVGAHGFLSF